MEESAVGTGWSGEAEDGDEIGAVTKLRIPMRLHSTNETVARDKQPEGTVLEYAGMQRPSRINTYSRYGYAPAMLHRMIGQLMLRRNGTLRMSLHLRPSFNEHVQAFLMNKERVPDLQPRRVHQGKLESSSAQQYLNRHEVRTLNLVSSSGTNL